MQNDSGFTDTSSKSTESQNKSSICLVFPAPPHRLRESVSIRINDLIKMIQPSVDRIYIITRNDIMQDIVHEKVFYMNQLVCPGAGDPILSVITGEIKAQLQIIRGIISLKKEVGIIFWRGRSSTFFVPLLIAKLKNKRSLLFVESKGSELVSKVYSGFAGIGGLLLSQVYNIVEKITYSLCDKLVVNVPGLLTQPSLAKYKHKFFHKPIADRFISPDFQLSKPPGNRQPVVGYFGRMSQEKGILTLVEAIAIICRQEKEVNFMIGGEGPLFEQVHKLFEEPSLQNRVEIHGWIPYNELPGYLNKIKLLVLPSYYEGLPNIVLEAMACGTPVLATPVGAIPDIIVDGKTGFIMEDNHPDTIVKNIIRALKHEHIDQISLNANAFVKAEYSYEAIAAKYREVLTNLQ